MSSYNTATITKAQIAESLNSKGYAVIENVLNNKEIEYSKELFYDWLESNKQLKEKHPKIDPHGIFRYGEIGHQRHAWYIRTRKSVQKPFQDIWNTNELVSSFDGCCWIPNNFKGEDKLWTHTDQAPNKKGLTCIQGFVSLTNNEERTFCVYEGSHKLHESYMLTKGLTGSRNWELIDEQFLSSISHTKKALHVTAGSMVLWDSRTFHHNRYGKDGEERIVQYVSFLPKNGAKNTPKMTEKRRKYLEDRRTTSHWAYPIKVNSKQPRTYGNNDLLVDYNVLKRPILEDLKEDIERLV